MEFTVNYQATVYTVYTAGWGFTVYRPAVDAFGVCYRAPAELAIADFNLVVSQALQQLDGGLNVGL